MFLPLHFDNELHKNLIFSYLTVDHKVNIFLDTNILLWSLDINSTAFREFFDFLGDLTFNKKLVIPNWVVFEFEKHIKNDKHMFKNFKSISKRLNNDLITIEGYLKLMIDDNSTIESKYQNKEELLNRFEKAKREIRNFCKIAHNRGDVDLETRIVMLKQFIQENNSSVHLGDIIVEVNRIWEFRYQNKIPPGFKDLNKPENKQGDLILWFELLKHSKESEKKISVLITNDNKEDWCSKHQLETGEVLVDAHPYLKHEFSNKIKDGEFYIVNLKFLFDTLFSIKYSESRFQKYIHLSDALGINLGKTDTEKIIEWIVRNDNIHNIVVNDIAFWEYSPNEMNIEKFKRYVIENVPFEIDIEEINWSELIVTLLI